MLKIISSLFFQKNHIGRFIISAFILLYFPFIIRAASPAVEFDKMTVEFTDVKDIPQQRMKIFFASLFSNSSKDIILLCDKDFLFLKYDQEKKKYVNHMLLKTSQQSLGSGKVYFDFGRLSGSDTDGIFFFSSKGVYYYSPIITTSKEQNGLLRSEGPEMIKISDITPGDSEGKSFRITQTNFIMDFNNDGFSDLILFDSEKIHFLIQNKDQSFIECAPPDIINNAHTDFYTTKDELSEVTKNQIQRPKTIQFEEYQASLNFKIGNFTNSPEKMLLAWDFCYPEKNTDPVLPGREFRFYTIRKNPTGYEFSENPDMRITLPDKAGIPDFKDLNNDGLIDFMIYDHNDDLFSPDTRISIYYKHKNQTPDISKPDQIIKSRQYGIRVFPSDINKDGIIDICLPFSQFDPASTNDVGKFLLGKDVDIKWLFYIGDSKGYSQPSSQISLQMPTEILGNPWKYNPIASADYDFNGDGFNDFILRTNEESAEIFLYNSDDKKISAKRAFKLSCHKECGIFPEDINNDGITDVITLNNTKKEIQINLSKKK